MQISGLPSFVLGYHGTDSTIAEELFAGRAKSLVPSENDYDWLGSGLYFWENSPARALDWATQFKGRKRKGGRIISDPAVIGAIIDLGHCMNLLDHHAIQLVKDRHRFLMEQCVANGTEMPKNENPPWMKDSADRIYRRLDCAVIQSIHDMVTAHNHACDQHKKPELRVREYDSVRAVFLEGRQVYPDSGFLDKTHIQICVRKPERIIGYFLPRDVS